MTLEEKRRKLHKYCTDTYCENCLLKGADGFSHVSDRNCLIISIATVEELDRALAIINPQDQDTYSHLADVIEKAVSDALARTTVKVKLHDDTSCGESATPQPDISGQTILDHLKAVKEYCDKYESCLLCDINIMCDNRSPADWDL